MKIEMFCDSVFSYNQDINTDSLMLARLSVRQKYVISHIFNVGNQFSLFIEFSQ